MEKFNFKEVVSFLREKFIHHKTKQNIDQEYQKERKSARDLKVNKNFGPRPKDQNGNRDISAI